MEAITVPIAICHCLAVVAMNSRTARRFLDYHHHIFESLYRYQPDILDMYVRR